VTVGDVSPIPPAAGGNIGQTFLIGNNAQGSVTINTQVAPSPITVTGSNSTVLGQTATGIGLLSLTGLGSNLSNGNDLVIGVDGAGSVVAQNQARVSATDDLVIGTNHLSSGTMFADGFGTTFDIGDDVLAGLAGQGLIQVTGGARLLADAASIGGSATGEGTVTVSGNNSLWRQDGAMTVGDAGRAILQILTQGRVENTSAVVGNAATGVGTVNVSGAGSVWDVAGSLNLAANGKANLSIVEGGRVTNTGAATLGDDAAAEGHVLVSGVGSTWNSGSALIVGDLGFGTLRILGGGRVTSTNPLVADNASARGEVLVEGTGAVWDITGRLDVSDPGEATLTISNDALVRTTGIVDVATAGEVVLLGGRLQIGGAAGLTNDGLVRGSGEIGGAVTNTANGEIRTQPGARLSLSSTLANNGLLNLDFGELEVNGLVSNASDIDIRNAVLRLSGGFNNNAGGSLSAIGGAIDVWGAVNNMANAQIVVAGESQIVFHDAVANSGQLFVMPGSNMLMLENIDFQAGSAVNLQLAGDESLDDFGRLEVAGNAALAGALNVQLSGGFAPQLGDSYQVLTAAGGITGVFGLETLPSLDPGLAWDVNYSSNSVTLSVVSGGDLAADFDNDGDVDGADLNAWKGGFGTAGSASKANGDSDGDLDVDGADFLTWQRQLGGGGVSAAAAAAVPEPASGSLSVLAVLLLGTSRRRPRSSFLSEFRQ